VLERRSPPTFDIVVEIQDRDRVAIHPDVGEAVDAILRGTPPGTEVRWLDDKGEITTEKTEIEKKPIKGSRATHKEEKRSRIYVFGVNRTRLEQMAGEMNIEVEIVDKLQAAGMFVTSKHYYRRKPQVVRDAENAGLPIYVLRSNTPPQVRQFLGTIHKKDSMYKSSGFQAAIGEAEKAVTQVKDGEKEVELSPQSSYIRRLQHLIAERNELESHSLGKDPNRRVRIYREQD
jgi:NACalpha-BTF3-like transcription factor